MLFGKQLFILYYTNENKLNTLQIMKNRVCGNTEERVNRFLRMCLEWQYDLMKNVKHSCNYYCTKYNVGKYRKEWFKDLKDVVVDRQYAFNKMNAISADRQKYDRNLGVRSNKVVIRPLFTQNNDFDVKSKGIKMEDDTILRNVAQSKLQKPCYDLNDVPHDILVKFMKKNGYIVIDENKILKKPKNKKCLQ